MEERAIAKGRRDSETAECNLGRGPRRSRAHVVLLTIERSRSDSSAPLAHYLLALNNCTDLNPTPLIR